jgi:hypothetical protein
MENWGILIVSETIWVTVSETSLMETDDNAVLGIPGGQFMPAMLSLLETMGHTVTSTHGNETFD